MPSPKTALKLTATALCLMLLCSAATAEKQQKRLPAFPGAEGYGATALNTSRKLPVVVHQVTNTNDSGPGSFRQAIADSSSDQYDIIIFRTGGVIRPTTKINFETGPACHVYIAGQTAPGDGIFFTSENLNDQTNIFDQGTHASVAHLSGLVIRYIHFDMYSPFPENHGGRGFRPLGMGDFILDHCTFKWNGDDLARISTQRGTGEGWVGNITVQRCIFAESITGHPTALCISGDNGPPIGSTSVHHNLFASVGWRNPRFVRVTAESVNNVIYNTQRSGEFAREVTVDYVANYFKTGPWERNPTKILFGKSAADPAAPPSIYVARNYAPHFGITSPTDDNWPLMGTTPPNTRFWAPITSSMRRSTRLPQAPVPVTVQTAPEAYHAVLADVGANRLLNDDGTWRNAQEPADARIINYVKSGGGPDHLLSHGEIAFPSVNPGTPYPDTDKDGMSDDWERKHFGHLARDGSEATPSGYLTIECFLNGTDPLGR